MLSLKFDHYSLEHVLSDEIKQIIDLSLGTTYKRKTYYFSDLLAIFIEIKGFVAQRFHNYMILKVLIIF